MLADYHVHSLGHGERTQTFENLESFVVQAIKEGINEIGFADHDWVERNPDFSIFEELREKYPQIDILVGIEVDHIIGRNEEISSYIKDQPFDYVLGGVHHLGENKWMFDMLDYIEGYRGRNIDELYLEYFKTVEDAALSGLYQILPHLDLIKIFGFRPKKPVLSLMGNLLEIIKEKSLAIEINTGGLFKPVEEIYPGIEILQACFKMGIPITIGSDAHSYKEVGRSFDAACALAYKVGYRQIATFRQRELIMHDLDQKKNSPLIKGNIA
ncbi:MAG: histidinol-phosphatase HisJ family protein [Bacillota bacterium]|nr:histidinol-phosphatase HisJ family protein [Clostridia bacterium]